MSIHINPKNKGKFNATKKRTGKTTEELTHSKNPLTRKRAIFALNAKKWKHDDGGYLYTDPPTLLDYLPNYRTLINNNINNNNMYNKFETGGTKRPQYDKEVWHDYFNTDHLSLNDEPEYYAGRIPEVTIRPLEENVLLNNALINAYANQANMFMPYGIPVNSYYGNGEGLQEALLEYNEPVNSEGLEEYIQNTAPYFTSGAGGRFVPYIPRFTNGIGGRFAEGGEMQMSPEEAAMMQLQGAEGMPPEMAGGMSAGAEQGMQMPLEGGMPPDVMQGQEQMSLEEMEEQLYEEERRAAFEEAREEAREEGKKTFEFEGRIYVTETGQLVNNLKACGGRLHGYGGNMFAYGGLDGPEPDAFNVSPDDPPEGENPAPGTIGWKMHDIPNRFISMDSYVLNPNLYTGVPVHYNPDSSEWEGSTPQAYVIGDKTAAEQKRAIEDAYRNSILGKTSALYQTSTGYRPFTDWYEPNNLLPIKQDYNGLGGAGSGGKGWTAYDEDIYNDEWQPLISERNFELAFKEASENGLKTFWFNGKLYNTNRSPQTLSDRQRAFDRKESNVVGLRLYKNKHRATKHAEGGPLNYDIEEPYPYDEGYTPELAYQQLLFNDLEAQRREAYNQLIKNRIKDRLLREYGITEDELNASRRREARKKKKFKK